MTTGGGAVGFTVWNIGAGAVPLTMLPVALQAVPLPEPLPVLLPAPPDAMLSFAEGYAVPVSAAPSSPGLPTVAVHST